MFKVNKNTRTISHPFLVFLLLTSNKQMLAGKCIKNKSQDKLRNTAKFIYRHDLKVCICERAIENMIFFFLFCWFIQWKRFKTRSAYSFERCVSYMRHWKDRVSHCFEADYVSQGKSYRNRGNIYHGLLWIRFYNLKIFSGPTPQNGQTHSNNSFELFECVWPSCGTGA